jgi:hypothetical protein
MGKGKKDGAEGSVPEGEGSPPHRGPGEGDLPPQGTGLEDSATGSTMSEGEQLAEAVRIAQELSAELRRVKADNAELTATNRVLQGLHGQHTPTTHDVDAQQARIAALESENARLTRASAELSREVSTRRAEDAMLTSTTRVPTPRESTASTTPSRVPKSLLEAEEARADRAEAALDEARRNIAALEAALNARPGRYEPLVASGSALASSASTLAASGVARAAPPRPAVVPPLHFGAALERSDASRSTLDSLPRLAEGERGRVVGAYYGTADHAVVMPDPAEINYLRERLAAMQAEAEAAKAAREIAEGRVAELTRRLEAVTTTVPSRSSVAQTRSLSPEEITRLQGFRSQLISLQAQQQTDDANVRALTEVARMSLEGLGHEQRRHMAIRIAGARARLALHETAQRRITNLQRRIAELEEAQGTSSSGARSVRGDSAAGHARHVSTGTSTSGTTSDSGVGGELGALTTEMDTLQHIRELQDVFTIASGELDRLTTRSDNAEAQVLALTEATGRALHAADEGTARADLAASRAGAAERFTRAAQARTHAAETRGLTDAEAASRLAFTIGEGINYEALNAARDAAHAANLEVIKARRALEEATGRLRAAGGSGEPDPHRSTAATGGDDRRDGGRRLSDATATLRAAAEAAAERVRTAEEAYRRAVADLAAVQAEAGARANAAERRAADAERGRRDVAGRVRGALAQLEDAAHRRERIAQEEERAAIARGESAARLGLHADEAAERGEIVGRFAQGAAARATAAERRAAEKDAAEARVRELEAELARQGLDSDERARAVRELADARAARAAALQIAEGSVELADNALTRERAANERADAATTAAARAGIESVQSQESAFRASIESEEQAARAGIASEYNAAQIAERFGAALDVAQSGLQSAERARQRHAANAARAQADAARAHENAARSGLQAEEAAERAEMLARAHGDVRRIAQEGIEAANSRALAAQREAAGHAELAREIGASAEARANAAERRAADAEQTRRAALNRPVVPAQSMNLRELVRDRILEINRVIRVPIVEANLPQGQQRRGPLGARRDQGLNTDQAFVDQVDAAITDIIARHPTQDARVRNTAVIVGVYQGLVAREERERQTGAQEGNERLRGAHGNTEKIREMIAERLVMRIVEPLSSRSAIREVGNLAGAAGAGVAGRATTTGAMGWLLTQLPTALKPAVYAASRNWVMPGIWIGLCVPRVASVIGRVWNGVPTPEKQAIAQSVISDAIRDAYQVDPTGGLVKDVAQALVAGTEIKLTGMDKAVIKTAAVTAVESLGATDQIKDQVKQAIDQVTPAWYMRAANKIFGLNLGGRGITFGK